MFEPSKPQTPLISIIMPAHNAGRYIAAAIRSVLAQSVPHWELLVMDDASTDDTEAVVQGFSDSRIRYQKLPRIGHPAGVRNAGLRLAQGELIAFLDADDLYFPDTLEKLSQPLLENARLSAVYGFAACIDEHDRPLPNPVVLAPRENPVPGEPPYQLPPGAMHSWKNIVTSNISCLLAALMLRRQAREGVGFFNEALCGPEDYEFYVRLYLHDYEGVQCLSDYVYQYRIHSASLTKAPEHCERVLTSCLAIMQWMFNEAPIPPEARRYKSRAYVSCYRYLARERLLHRQPALARQIALRALGDNNIRRSDFMRACGPVLLRSFLPSGLDEWFVQIRRSLRTRRLEMNSPSPSLEASAG